MMRNLLHAALIGGLLLGAAAGLSGCYGTSGTIAVHGAPPEPTIAYYDDYDNWVWVEGRWSWYDASWHWQPGYWIAARPGFVYTQGYWDYRAGRYAWIRGQWIRSRNGYVWARGYWGPDHSWQRGHWVERRPGQHWHNGHYQNGRWVGGRWSNQPRVRDHRANRPPAPRTHRPANRPSHQSPPPRRNERVRSHRGGR